MLYIFDRHLDQQLAEMKLPASVSQSVQSQRTKLAAVAIPEDQGPAIQQRIRHAIDESFVAGFRVVMWIASALALASAITAWAVIRSAG